MMKSYDQLVKINNDSNWLYILDYTHIFLVFGGSGSDETTVLMKLI